METLTYICPICHGKVLFGDEAQLTAEDSSQRVTVDKLYCPHCEMLVEPMVRPSESSAAAGSGVGDAGEENRGRTREGGSNGGGSQRGDMSDQGASQWRRDPQEGERNSWQDKR
jgi:hypothetical protein